MKEVLPFFFISFFKKRELFENNRGQMGRGQSTKKEGFDLEEKTYDLIFW